MERQPAPTSAASPVFRMAPSGGDHEDDGDDDDDDDDNCENCGGSGGAGGGGVRDTAGRAEATAAGDGKDFGASVRRPATAPAASGGSSSGGPHRGSAPSPFAPMEVEELAAAFRNKRSVMVRPRSVSPAMQDGITGGAGNDSDGETGGRRKLHCASVSPTARQRAQQQQQQQHRRQSPPGGIDGPADSSSLEDPEAFFDADMCDLDGLDSDEASAGGYGGYADAAGAAGGGGGSGGMGGHDSPTADSGPGNMYGLLMQQRTGKAADVPAGIGAPGA
ncbi:unnamed protein product [Phaeothamnion confervicola]